MKRTLEARVMRLEKSNRRLMLALAILSPLAIGTFLLGAARQPPVYSASGFDLVDEAGAVRAEFALRDGEPGL